MSLRRPRLLPAGAGRALAGLARLGPRSIFGRIFGLYSVTLLVFVGGGLALFYNYQAYVELDAAQERAEALASVMMPVLSDSAVIGDDDTIQRTLERAIYRSSFASARFIDVRGLTIAAQRSDPPVVQAPQWLIDFVSGRLWDVNRPISVGGRDYGVLRLSFAPAVVAGDLWRPARAALLLAAFSAALGLVLIRLPLVSWLGQIDRLRLLEKEIDRGGDARVSQDEGESAPTELRETFQVLNRAARSLQAQREQAAVTLRTIADAVFTLDAEGVVLLANPAAGMLLRRPVSSLLGRSIHELLPAFFAEAGALLPWHRRELKFETADGHPLVIDSTLSPILGTERSPVGYVLACRDVSEQHALAERLVDELASREAALDALRSLLLDLSHSGVSATLYGDLGADSVPGLLPHEADRVERSRDDDIRAVSLLVVDLVAQVRERSEQLNAIFALSPDGFVSFDAQRRVQYASPAFTRLTGLGEVAVRGLDEAAFVDELAALCRPGAALRSLEALRAQGPSDDASQLERIELERPLPRVLQVALREGGSEAISQVLYLRDITHEIEVERIKSEFLSTAAHELRTPMASIYGFADLLMRRDLAREKRLEVLGIIHRQTELMVSIINELLDLARIEARRGKDFVLETVDLVTLTCEAARDFKPPGTRDSPLMLGFDDRVAEVCVDRLKMAQALGNVLSNAYKYSPGGGPVRMRLSEGHLPGREHEPAWGVRIEDLGIGMTPEQLARVSERFYRADTTGSIPGTGLGMSIVKEIIELLGGGLEIESEPGVGTSVTLWLPAVVAASSARPERPALTDAA